MNQRVDTEASRAISRAGEATRSDRGSRVSGRFPATDMPTGLMLLLVGIGLPRTILADLGIVPPESGLLYYLLALTPFAVWLAVAVLRRTRRPFLDFIMVGVLYGLSLVVVHQVLWNAGPSLGHQPPASAVDFAARFSPSWYEFALRVYTSGIAMLIGLGTGLVAAFFAIAAHAWRSRRTRQTGH